MKTILLVNEFFSDNVGDQAINKGITKLLISKGCQVESAGFSRADKLKAATKINNNEFISKNIPLFKNSLLRSFYWLFKNLSRVVKCSYKCDGIAFIGGGQLILERSSFAISMFTWVFFLKLFRNKVIIFSVGVGEDFCFYERFLYKITFKLADEIFIREKLGIKKLKQKFNIVAKFIPDTAYALTSPVIKVNQSKRLSVFITSYDVHTRYAEELGLPVLTHANYHLSWKDKINYYQLKGYKIHFSWTTQSDKLETINFLTSNNPDYNYSKFEGELSIKEIISDLSLSELVIAGRMHALILAQICNCEIVPWIISKKIEMFAEEYLFEKVSHLREQLNEITDEIIGE